MKGLLPSWVFVVPAALLIIAVFPLQYGYYQFLRLVVCGTAAFAATGASASERTAWLVVFGGIALLYNPFMPIHLTREIWIGVNAATALLYLVGLRSLASRV